MQIAVERAYREGFSDGADHNNLDYKYPPENIAWRFSESRLLITGTVMDRKDMPEWTLPNSYTFSEDEPINIGTIVTPDTPAFPHFDPEVGGNNGLFHCGMSMRDYFAARFAAAMIQQPPSIDTQAENLTNWCDYIARSAYQLADAMVREQERFNA